MKRPRAPKIPAELLDTENLPEWLTAAHIAAIRKCHRITAWRFLQSLRSPLGSEHVKKEGKLWRVRSSALSKYIRKKAKPLEERLATLEREHAELREAFEESERRARMMSSQLFRALDVLKLRRASPFNDGDF